jgi:hypothetical protein
MDAIRSSEMLLDSNDKNITYMRLRRVFLIIPFRVRTTATKAHPKWKHIFPRYYDPQNHSMNLRRRTERQISLSKTL